jgi:DNA-binding GntR family transcriptional regulator
MDASYIIGKEFNRDHTPPLSEQITEILTNSIVKRQLKEGQRLVESELQKKFGVSRGPIRESFRMLERNGLITIIPRKGTYVRKILRKDIEENFAVRAYLEGLAARLGIPNLTAEDIREIESALAKMAEVLRDGDLESHLEYHSEFHKIIYRASKNDTLIGIIESLRFQANWFRFSYLHVIPDSFAYGIGIHQEILDLLIKKDSDRVETLMKKHILITLERFSRFLESEGTGNHAERLGEF